MTTSPDDIQKNAWQTAITDLESGAMETAAQSYKAWFDCAVAMNTEVNRFITQRLQRDAQLPLTIAQCRSPEEVMRTQIDFFKTMADDYAIEAEKMGSILSEGFHSIDRPSTLHSASIPDPVDEQPVKHLTAA